MSEKKQRIILDFEDLEKEAEQPGKVLEWGLYIEEHICSQGLCHNSECMSKETENEMYRKLVNEVMHESKIPPFLKGVASSKKRGCRRAICECLHCFKELFWFHIPSGLALAITKLKEKQKKIEVEK